MLKNTSRRDATASLGTFRIFADKSHRVDATRFFIYVIDTFSIVRLTGINKYAGVAKLVYAPGLGPGAARRGGSSPLSGTINI